MEKEAGREPSSCGNAGRAHQWGFESPVGEPEGGGWDSWAGKVSGALGRAVVPEEQSCAGRVREERPRSCREAGNSTGEGRSLFFLEEMAGGGGGGGCKGVAGEKETFPEPPYQGGPESLFWRKQRHQIEFAGSWDSGLGADARTWKAWLRADSWMEKTSRERRDLGCRSQAIGSQRSGGERA